MKNVNCNENENKLFDCYRELTGRYCDHDDDVGVVCSNVQTTEAPISIDPGEFQGTFEGQVFIYLLNIV